MEAVRIHPWTRREYERMGEAGVLAPDTRTKLIDGEAIRVANVANATLAYNWTTKPALYARPGMPEHLIVNLANDVVEGYRDPAGTTYCTKMTLVRDDQTAPVEQPDRVVHASDLLP